MFTKSQQRLYRPMVNRAWQIHCAETGKSPDADAAHKEWYRQQLVETCGIYTTKQASPTKDFDALMAHFASIAGDEAWIRRTAEGDERRMRHLIRQEINAGQISEPYIAGILRNMNIDANLVDVPAAHLWKLWNALKRHNARHAATQHACA